MNVNKQRNGTTLTVAIEGRLDTLTAPILEELLTEALEGVTEVVLDCEKLEYTSSAGLRVILEIQQTMEDRGGVTKLIHVNEVVLEVLEFTGFLDFLVIE